jgi:maleylpyruvate isomerase
VPAKGKTYVVVTGESNRQVIDAVKERTRKIAGSLSRLSDDELHEPSELPEWSRLTIACHLRFGAEALTRMTHSAVQGLPVAYYPEGREVQRPQTLVPLPGESPQAVVESLACLSEELNQEWSSVDPVAWGVDVVEPPENRDLGPVPLHHLPLLRLTEVEVHGTDLGLNLGDWSEIFVSTVLPMRLEWLNIRRANHRAFDSDREGSWLLVATDGPTYKVSVDGPDVESHAASPDTPARAVIEATSRDLLALLLGRAVDTAPVMMGDIAFGRSFSRAFPGP